MSVWIRQVYKGYYVGGCSPPDSDVEYKSPEILPRGTLEAELLQRGVSQEHIEEAFAAADGHGLV